MTALQIALIVAGCIAGAALIAFFIWFSNNAIVKTKYVLSFPWVKRAVKIVQLSDLHGKTFGSHNCRLVAKVAAAAPDIIVITGDLIHRYNKKNTTVALETVSALSAVSPVVYISGNHEMRNKGYGFLKKGLIEAGATVLDNACAEVCGVTFAGLNGACNRNGTVFKLSREPSDKILLAHMPHHIERYAEAGYPLVLSGHAHGGQWRIPFTKRGIYAPGQGLFPKLISGVHSVKNTKLIISRGLGNSKFPLRLFNRPEIVELVLYPEHTPPYSGAEK